jgi:hypothetical protein
MEAIVGSGKKVIFKSLAQYVLHTKRRKTQGTTTTSAWSLSTKEAASKGANARAHTLSISLSQQILCSLMSTHTKFQQNKLYRKKVMTI